MCWEGFPLSAIQFTKRPFLFIFQATKSLNYTLRIESLDGGCLGKKKTVSDIGDCCWVGLMEN